MKSKFLQGESKLNLKPDPQERDNIIQFEKFQNLSSEYKYRKKELEELRNKKQWSSIKLTENEEKHLSFCEGFCRGYIDAVHKTMSKLSITTVEVQIQTLENLKNSLSKDIENTLSLLKMKLGDKL